jgi:hypothetical protein
MMMSRSLFVLQPAGLFQTPIQQQTAQGHTADHDRIRVDGRNDDFRKLKFKVTDSPLNMHKIIVTYDNGPPESLEVREDIQKGGETRDIDLSGGKRSIRTIEFWYDTKGLLNGKADVTAFGKR